SAGRAAADRAAARRGRFALSGRRRPASYDAPRATRNPPKVLSLRRPPRLPFLAERRARRRHSPSRPLRAGGIRRSARLRVERPLAQLSRRLIFALHATGRQTGEADRARRILGG